MKRRRFFSFFTSLLKYFNCCARRTCYALKWFDQSETTGKKKTNIQTYSENIVLCHKCWINSIGINIFSQRMLQVTLSKIFYNAPVFKRTISQFCIVLIWIKFIHRRHWQAFCNIVSLIFIIDNHIISQSQGWKWG